MNTPTLTDQDRRMIRLHCDWVRRSGFTERTTLDRDRVLRRVAVVLPNGLTLATERDLDTWQAGLRVSLSSIATYTSHLRSFYRWLLDAGHVDVDASARLPRPRVPERQARPIPEADLELALGCAPEPLRTWLLLAGYMGLRSHEIAQIRREDVTELAGRLVLSGIGKGRKPYRMVVPVEVLPFLRPWLRARTGPLWLLESKRACIRPRPLRPADVTNQTTALMRSLGLPYTLHQLRHRFGTCFYGSTKDLLLTQDVMRHANPSSTRLYVETTRAEATAAMDRLSASLRPRPERGKRKPPPVAEAA